MDHLLEVKDLSKSFGGVKALDKVSFTVPKGGILALIGPNGAGKTTALNCISAVYPIDSGDLLYDGKKVQHLKAHQLARAGLTRTFQNLQIFSGMTVLENVMVGMHVRPGREFIPCMLRIGGAAKEDREARDKAMEMLGFFDLDHLAQKTAGQLSYGDRKRVELARALVGNPKLVLLDEPVAGLNLAETDRMGDTLQKINDAGVGLVLVEHDMGLVMRISQHVVVLHFGRKIAEGTCHEVQNHPDVLHIYLGGAGKELGPIA